MSAVHKTTSVIDSTYLLRDDRPDPALPDSAPLYGHGILEALRDNLGQPERETKILLGDGRRSLAFQRMGDGQVDPHRQGEQVGRDGRMVVQDLGHYR